MNTNRRKELQKIAARLRDVMDMVDGIYTDIEEIQGEEQEAFDNLPESIQSSSRGENMESAIDELDDIISTVDTLKDDIESIASQIEDFEY